jgi:uncharacterized protein YcbK (DUF882 family)
MNLRHFSLSEFDSPDLPGSGERMCKNFLRKLDKARKLARTPFVINSGYRTDSHNKKVKGSKNSAHLIGKAADIACSNDAKRFLILQALLKVGFTRIGIAKTFIHVDNDESKNSNRTWTY